jgi:hypothetical protein
VVRTVSMTGSRPSVTATTTARGSRASAMSPSDRTSAPLLTLNERSLSSRSAGMPPLPTGRSSEPGGWRAGRRSGPAAWGRHPFRQSFRQPSVRPPAGRRLCALQRCPAARESAMRHDRGPAQVSARRLSQRRLSQQ